MNSHKPKRHNNPGKQTAIRLKLIIAFHGNVALAETALAFVNGNPEASEQYLRFKQWEAEQFADYCASGFRKPQAISPEEQSPR